MYTTRNSILILALTISLSMIDLFFKTFVYFIVNMKFFHFLVLLWCTVQPSYGETTDAEHPLAESTADINDVDDLEEFYELFRRASLRPYAIQQRASLRPMTGKRASLRPFTGKRASLRPYAGKRASLRPATYAGKRMRRNVLLFDQE